MKQKTISTNYLAMQALHQGELYQAQELFRKNLKAERNALTLNNLGAFYSEYNILNPDLFERDGRTYALHYLSLAQAFDTAGKSFFAKGNVYTSLAKYDQAANNFMQSFECNKKFAAIYNAGNCYMRQRNFLSAHTCFEISRTLITSFDEKNDVLPAIAYAKAYLKTSDAEEAAQPVFLLEDDCWLYDKFKLSYLLQDTVQSLYFAEKLQKCCLDLPVQAMVLDVFLQSGNTVAAQCYFQTEYDIMKEAGRCTLKDRAAFRKCFSDANYRKEIIEAALPPLDFQKICIYIDCPYH